MRTTPTWYNNVITKAWSSVLTIFFWFADIIYVFISWWFDSNLTLRQRVFFRQITGWQQEFFAQDNLDFLDLIIFFLAKAGLEKIFQAMWPQGLICYFKQHSAICPVFFSIELTAFKPGRFLQNGRFLGKTGFVETE